MDSALSSALVARCSALGSALSTKEKAYTIHTEVVRNCNVKSSRFSLNNLTFGFTSFQLINPKRATARTPAKRKHTYCYILKFYCTFLMVFLKLLCLWLHTTSSNPYQVRYQRATARYSALSSKEKAYILLHTKVLLYIPDGFPSTTLPLTSYHFK